MLKETLKNSPRPRVYLANPGNLGDAAIRLGTLKFFRSIRLDYEEVRKIPKTCGTFIFGGGGGWCRNWNTSAPVAKAVDRSVRVIVLPSTYAIKSSLYNDFRTTFFRRDNRSRSLVPHSIYHQDMAFHLWEDLAPRVGKGTGYFMRTDRESLSVFPIPPSNRDISIKGTTYDPIDGFIEAINAVEEVHTDRLHVAVFGCMLRKKVVFYEGNYWKNEAVYETRLKGNYDVTFRKHDNDRYSEGEAH